jgi:Phosphopantetheine attachment site
LLSALLAAKVGEIFNIDALGIDVSLPLPHHGVDSLIAVQFKNWLSSAVKARVSIFEVLQGPSLIDFASLVAVRSSLVAKAS